jgi:hypothetical protein
MVVLPSSGLIPIKKPTAILQAMRSGDAPMRISAKTGSTARR